MEVIRECARVSVMAAKYSVFVAFLAVMHFAPGYAMTRFCPTGTSNFTYATPALPLPYDAYMPAIDNETMFIHSTRHVGAAVNAVNAILSRYPQLQGLPLTEIVEQVGTSSFTKKYGLAANDSTALRNNAGSLYNHAIFWKVMTTYNTSSPTESLSSKLLSKINAKWGSPTGLLDALRAAGGSVFGSGWAWLVYQKGELAIVTTPNQDNPIMKGYVSQASQGIPLLGVDVWEHAYYLKYRNLRASYLAAWVNLVDWARVQKNYYRVEAGKKDGMWC